MIRDYVVVDLETTGLDVKTEKIIEIGAVKVRKGEIVDTFDAYVNPGKSLSQRIVELTGITDRDLEDAGTIDDVFHNFLDFAGEDVLIGHRIIFDYSFLKKAATNLKITFERQGIDTLGIARRFLPELESKTLGALCEYYGIELQAHRAANDAMATAILYEKLFAGFYEKEADLFCPRQLVFKIKKESPIMPKQKEQIRRAMEKYQLTVSQGHFLEPDGKVILERTDMDHMTKNEASRLIGHLLANYGR